jgi:thiamine kinase-like enzyme
MSLTLTSRSSIWQHFLGIVFLRSHVSSMSTSTDAHTPTKNLLPALRTAFPTVESYKVLTSIVQNNANGFILQLTDKVDTNTPSKVFLKQVEAADYLGAKKDWPDLRRTLMYGRTEARFYASMGPILRQRGFVGTPKCYLAECDLSGWVPEDEKATAKADPSVDKASLPDPQKKGGLLILECVSDETHFQDSPLTMDQCHSCLGAVAKLHAAAWQDKALLEQAEQTLSKASFHLSTRNPKELAGIVESWANFREAFQEEMKETGLWEQESVRDLGRRLAVAAEYISHQVSPSYNEHFATLIHGDYKALNVFLAHKEEDAAVLVDFASAGVGLGLSDVAMHVHHAVVPEQLENGGEEALVKYYWQTLTSELTNPAYPWETALRHYRMAVVDYGRFFMARMWKSATPATMLKKKDNKNVNLINRSPPAAMAFVRRLDVYLSEIEKEMANNK